MVRVHNTGEQQASSWTGFNILIRDHKEVKADTIGYLPTINALATQASSFATMHLYQIIHYILKRCKDNLIENYITAEHRASALRELWHQISSQSPGKVSHADLGETQIKRDKSDVACLVDLIDNNWTNPFGSDPSDLVGVSTGAVATPEVFSGLLTAHKQG